MKTVGKQLQDARTAKGWSPELAARETKIRVDRLHDLESDDYSNFSSPTYARGFVRTYARALNLDEYKILRQLDNKLPEDDNATFANDTGVPYMPEPSQVSKPFEVGRGVYIAGGIAGAVLLLIAFILVQSYRAGYFADAPVSTPAVPATNALPIAPDTRTARAMPADGSAPPVALPVDNPAVATAVPATSPTDTNNAPRALPVDLNDLAATTTAPAAPLVAAAPAIAPAPDATPVVASAVPSPVPVVTTSATVTDQAPVPAPSPATVSTATSTPPRALPVDLGALNATSSGATTPAPAPAEPHAVHSLSARDSNAHSSVDVTAAKAATDTLIAETTPPAAPVQAPVNPAPAESPVIQTPDPAPPAPAPVETSSADSAAPSSLGPASIASPEPVPPAGDSALTGASGSTGNGTPGPATAAPDEKFHGQRLVLTASHDSFVRVIALDGSTAGQVRYSSTLHGGQSISFNDRKYSINVGDPSAVDIALDGINYGPHSDNSEPDTFTVESRTP